MYLLNDEKHIFQYKPLEYSDYDTKMDEYIDKFLLLTTELLEKEKIIEIMKNIDKNDEYLLISYER